MQALRFIAPVLVLIGLSGLAHGAEVDFAAAEVREARALIQSGKAECVLIVAGRVQAPKSGHGVSPLLSFYTQSPALMENAIVVDKVIGRAAAAIVICGKARAVFGELMSEDGAEFLRQHGIAVGYARMVPRILNQKRDGLCPLERSVLGITDPAKALAALKRSIAELQAAAPRR